MKFDYKDAKKVWDTMTVANKLSLHPDDYVPVICETKNGKVIQIDALVSIKNIVRIAVSGMNI